MKVYVRNVSEFENKYNQKQNNDNWQVKQKINLCEWSKREIVTQKRDLGN